MVDRTVTVRLRGIVSDYQRGMRDAARSTKELGGTVAQSARDNKQHFDAIGTAALGMGAAAAFGLKQAADASISFETAFAGVRKTVNATPAEFAKMSSEIRKMATDIPVTVEEIAGIGEAAGQLGISKDNIMGFSRTMADLGVATNMASTEAATSLARLANITQMPETEFDRLGSTVVALGNNLATTESEIVEMGLRLAGAGAQVGMTEAQIMALGGALSSVGIQAEAGGSAISKVMIEIASQVETGGENLELFAETAGMSAEQFSDAYRDDATGAIISFVEGLGSMEEQGGSTLQTLAALGIEEVRMRDALLRTSGAGDVLREAVELGNQAWEENNALTKEAEQRYGTTASKIQMAKNQVNDLLITVGDALAPTIGEAAEAIGGLAGALDSLPEPLVKVGVGLTGLVSAAGLGGGALLLLLPRIVATKDALTALNVTKATTLARMKGLAAFMTGPWGVALAAAGAGWSVYNRHQDDAASFAATLNAELADTPGALRNVSDEMLLNRLRSKDVESAWLATGLSLDTLRSAMQGNAEAAEKVRNAMDKVKDPIEVLKTAIPGLRDEKRDLAHTTHDLLNGTETYTDSLDPLAVALGHVERATQAGARQFTDITSGILAVEGATDSVTSTLTAGGLLERMREFGTTTEDAADAVGEVATEAEEAESAFDGLAPSIVAAFEALSAGFDPMTRYQENLQAINDASRATAEGIAESHNERIQKQIEALDSTKATFAEEKAALEGQKQTWDEHFDGIEQSFSAYMDSLNQTLEDQRAWHANIQTIREVAGDAYADMLATQGPEFADLHAEIARQEHDVIRTAATQAQTIRDEANRFAIDQLIAATPEWVSTAGTLAESTVLEISEKLGLTPEVVQGHLNDSRAVAQAQMKAMHDEMGPAAARVVAAMAFNLGLGTEKAATIINDWANATGTNLNPLLAMVGKEPIPLFARKLLAGARHAGGPIDDDPGYRGFSGPPRDDERLILAQTGEHMLSRRDVDRLGGHRGVEQMLTADDVEASARAEQDAHKAQGITWPEALKRDRVVHFFDGAPGWNVPGAASAWDQAAPGMNVNTGVGKNQSVVYTSHKPDANWYGIGNGADQIALNTAKGLNQDQRFKTAIHEMGHVLGFGHPSAESIMNPNRAFEVSGPTSWDIAQLLEMFPPFSSPNTDGTALPNITIPPIPSFDPLQHPLSTTGEAAVGHARSAVVAWVNEQMAAVGSAAGGAVPGGAGVGGGIGVAAMMGLLRGQFPGLPLISGYRPGAVTATGNASWHGKNRAVDIPPRMDVFNWLRANYGSQALELIFSPAGNNQIYRGKNHYFSEPTRGDHWDHIHWAMANGGIINEEVRGIGLSSGDSYSFGERGPERVTPMTSTASHWTPGGGSIDYDALGAAVAKHLSGPMSTSTAQIAAAAAAMPSLNMDGQKVASITKEHMRCDEVAYHS